ncbi:MAG: heavy-metal-associated domain-containing protein [Chloroflexaceae bacterium]|nr:heavy-metal-associated domain-containing protein [Chloroflexaceae bacterium]NJL34079.1 heavy-metal-associated domain-containing protein [Chloroflexaceae bacterium]NJO04085.1 heavy-metal-associated domain-containing protein [Chloroflexaceae bacterium]NJO83951.1 heavy-metal-associated domain-containing protein [Blastochloris sp.]
MTTETFMVPEMLCHHCINAITKEVTALAGVQSVKAELSSKHVMVEHDEAVPTEAIIAAINEAGYQQVAVVGK